ncbi:hypothetical protein BS47DRAFT_42638 [Hydnum rufescens UP504]|uniref:Uncharacterized protein n=1 Tax=Hydnum rufescens UP504 TaxID=1448309 RepID=A0A9P6ARX4_9AGAM|nr:hypothetical protein BS47DRAFT_42638 [Hydnum rufescens UP504]
MCQSQMILCNYGLIIAPLLSGAQIFRQSRPVCPSSNFCITCLTHIFNIWCLFVWSSFGFGGGGMLIHLMHLKWNTPLTWSRLKSGVTWWIMEIFKH